jgi:hypothetical protein
MNAFWKWLLIVLGVLILLGLIVSPFIMHSFVNSGGYSMMQRGNLDGGPNFRGDFDDNPYLRGGFGRMPMHRGFMPFGGGMLMIPLMGFLCLFPLGILGLAIYGIVALVNHPKSTPLVVPPAVVEPVTELCVKCGKPLQADWTTCPHCGQRVRRSKN